MADLLLRTEPRPGDARAIRRIVASTGFFHDFEIDVAVELLEERLARGLASEYHFLFHDGPDADPIAYACLGPIACTRGSYDLYWIAVDAQHQGRGLGKALMHAAARAAAAGLPDASGHAEPGRNLYIETSSKPIYEPTRRFYDACGCRLDATLRDFYAPGDHKLIYRLPLAPP